MDATGALVAVLMVTVLTVLVYFMGYTNARIWVAEDCQIIGRIHINGKAYDCTLRQKEQK